ncbi:mCG140704, isoform CRA_b, partial [Mus musculus]
VLLTYELSHVLDCQISYISICHFIMFLVKEKCRLILSKCGDKCIKQEKEFHICDWKVSRFCSLCLPGNFISIQNSDSITLLPAGSCVCMKFTDQRGGKNTPPIKLK